MKNPTPSLQRDLTYLLMDLCRDWGFCIPPEDAARIVERGHWGADEFAAEVMRAEGLPSESNKQWFRRIRNLFEERFGQSVSSDDYLD